MKRLSGAIPGLLVFAMAAAFSPASCGPPTTYYNGVCTGSDALTGTTIVIDFQQLDGLNGMAAPDIVRCSPNPGGAARTGIKALQDAGITVTGTTRWGLAFVCRLQGRPTASEPLPVSGNPTYKEACTNTPPPSAYWSYWYANGSGTTWTYSATGASNRNVLPGGFEGWSFALNKTASTSPPPGYTPRNPAK
jgi:hypothetical protein